MPLLLTTEQSSLMNLVEDYLDLAYREGTGGSGLSPTIAPMQSYDNDDIMSASGMAASQMRKLVKDQVKNALAAYLKVVGVGTGGDGGVSTGLTLTDVQQYGDTRWAAIGVSYTKSEADARFAPIDGVSTTFTGTCLSTDVVGDVVRISGASKQVRRVTSSELGTHMAVGIITSKPTATTAVVQCAGLVVGLYTGLTPGQPVFVSSTGRPTQTLPTGSAGSEQFMQAIGIAADSNLLLVSITPQVTSYYV